MRPGFTGMSFPDIWPVLDADGWSGSGNAGILAVKGPTGCRYMDDPAPD